MLEVKIPFPKEPQQILDGLKEAVEDVKNHRVSGIDTLWDLIDD